MKRSQVKSMSSKPQKSRTALTPEARENQLMSLATDLVEQRLRDGTASSQEVSTIIRLCSTKARLENEILELNKKLIAAKTEAVESNKDLKQMYRDAVKAMRKYSGQGSVDDYDED